MAKTDKELAAEITSTYIESWFQKPNTGILQAKEVSDFFKSIYQTVSSCETDDK